MKFPLYVVTRTSKNDKVYTALYVDLGYKQKTLAFGLDICELVNIMPQQLNYFTTEPVRVGFIDITLEN